MISASVARDDGEALVQPLVQAGLDLPAERARQLELLLHAVVEAAALREWVVFDAHPGRAGLLELADEPDRVDRVAPAGVAVDEDRDVDAVDDLVDDADVVLGTEDVGVREPVRGVELEARDPEAVGACLLGDLRAERVVDPEEHGRLRPGEQLLDRRPRRRNSRMQAVRVPVVRDTDCQVQPPQMSNASGGGDFSRYG